MILLAPEGAQAKLTDQVETTRKVRDRLYLDGRSNPTLKGEVSVVVSRGFSTYDAA